MYVRCVDYVGAGQPDSSEWMQTEFEKCFAVKTQRLGPHTDQIKEVNILNRVMAWHDKKGIVYEVDPRHAEILLGQLKVRRRQSCHHTRIRGGGPNSRGSGAIGRKGGNFIQSVGGAL